MDEKQGIRFKKGRGAQAEVANRFEERVYVTDPDHIEHLIRSDEDPSQAQATSFIKVYPKSILNKVTSPDVGLSWSMNPYQGCEHGCAYCYARNSHEFWGYNAGLDFEQRILVKQNAPELLEKALQKASWRPETIMLSGNTDCYQPIEGEMGITRQLLEVCLKYRQPLGIITKNTLLLRDLDLLKALAQSNLVHVQLSITTLDEALRRKLEPRTATARKKLMAIGELTAAGVPVGIMAAPIIPGLNSHEIFDIAEQTAKHGALTFNHTMVRLNGLISDLFLDWLDHHYPDRAQKVKHLIQESHGGKLNDSRFGKRMTGEGEIAGQVKAMVKLARARFLKNRKMPEYNRKDFVRAPGGQLNMFS